MKWSIVGLNEREEKSQRPNLIENIFESGGQSVSQDQRNRKRAKVEYIAESRGERISEGIEIINMVKSYSSREQGNEE